MNIIIGSEGKGVWGAQIINYLLKKIGYINITYENTDNCSVIISSHDFSAEPLWNNSKKKYIYWSGEHFIPNKNKNETDSLYACTTILKNMNNSIYIPYILYSPYLYKPRKYTNNQRQLRLAYCHSNPIKEREEMFNLFVEKTSDSLCHAYGKCCGKYLNTKNL